MRTALRSLAVSSLLLVLAGTAGARTRPHYGGTVRAETSAASDASVQVGLVAETLTSTDALGAAQPWLAERWESQDGGRRWQFSLRANVRFHDGIVLSAADVVRALNAKQGAPWRNVRASGTTVIFESDDPQLSLPSVLALPQYEISKTDGSGSIIGTGPFHVTGMVGNTSKLAAFDDYWRGRPYVDAVEISNGRGLRDQWMDLSVAHADIVEVPAEQIRRAQQERMRVLVSQNLELIALVPAADSQALQDARMRQAISAAIDRTSLLNVIFQKQGEVSSGVLPNWMTGYDFLFATTQNLPLARDLHAQAKQAGTITVAYDPHDGIQQLLAERVALNARDAGIVVQTVPRTGNTEFDLNLIRLALPSPNASVALGQVASTIGADPLTVDPDPEVLFRNERDLLTSCRVVPLLYVPGAFAAGPRVHNWALTTLGAPDVPQLWVEDRR